MPRLGLVTAATGRGVLPPNPSVMAELRHDAAPDSRSILCINSGSSSLKFALYRISAEAAECRADGVVEDIGLPNGRLRLRVDAKDGDDEAGTFPDHVTALHAALRILEAHGASNFDAVGHRLVSGGPRYRDPCRIDAEFRKAIGEAVPFAPHHLPAEIAAIEMIASLFPDLPQVACFDTYFHRNMPERASRLPLPRDLWDEGVRNYGFHGLSYEYIVSALDGAPGRTVIAHLGSGASLAAVRNGISVDTTMGLTPFAGLIMGSRCGDLDPGVLLYLINEKHYDAPQLERTLDQLSGLAGISGTSSDMEKLLAARDGDPHAAQAVEMFCYSAQKHIAAMIAALSGIDTLVFTGGIGEHAPAIRSEICSGLRFLGIELDSGANTRDERSLQNPAGSVRVLMIPTDEALTIARHSFRLLQP